MAGYVAPVENWLAFSDEWQKILDLNEHPHRPMKKAKMRAMRHPRGLKRAEMFYRVIEAHAVAAFSCTIDAAGMRQALAEFPWPSWVINPGKLANPYYFAFQAITESLAVVQEEFGLFEPVDFVFDEISCKSPCIDGWMDIKKFSRPEISKYLGHTPIFRPEEELLGLQAADLYANWVHSWALKDDEEAIKNLDFAWKANFDIPRFNRSFGKDDFLMEWRRGLLVHQLRNAGVRNAHEILSTAPTATIVS